jgi:hypothetical protein
MKQQRLTLADCGEIGLVSHALIKVIDYYADCRKCPLYHRCKNGDDAIPFSDCTDAILDWAFNGNSDGEY